MTPMTRQKIFTCKTSSYSQTTERKPLMPGHMLHEAYYYVVTVSAAVCKVQYSFKTTHLNTFGSHLIFLKSTTFIPAGILEKRDESGGRILLGDNFGSRVVMLRTIRFHCVGIQIPTRLLCMYLNI